jgi:hypothetical protein
VPVLWGAGVSVCPPPQGRTVIGERRRTLARSALAAAIVWAWFASGVRPFTVPAEVLTFVPGFLVLVLTLRPGAKPDAVVGRTGRWLPWAALALAFGALELSELFSKPRSAHPTLSSLTNTLLDTHPSRFVGYAVWLALGWLLVRDLHKRHE